MKDKPTRHQATNTFRFEGEAERFRKLRVSLREFLVKKSNIEDIECESYFKTSIEKWNQLNLSQAFQVC